MFFASDIFVKKGAFSTMWLAGSGIMKRLSKNTILQAAIEKLTESVANPPVPLALRAVSTLVLGLTRIHNKKCVYVLQDAQDIQLRMRVDIRTGASGVDLPAVVGPALHARAVEQINIPEFQFEAFDFGFDQEIRFEHDADLGAPIQRGRHEKVDDVSAGPSSDNSMTGITLRKEGSRSPGLQTLIDREIEPTFAVGEMELPPIDFDVQDREFDVPEIAVIPRSAAKSDASSARMSADIESEEGSKVSEAVSSVLLSATGKASRKRALVVSKEIELPDQRMRTQLVSTGDTWMVQRPRATMETLTGRTSFGSLTRLGLAGKFAARLKQPTFLAWNTLAPELVSTFRVAADAIEEEAKARPRQPAAARHAVVDERDFSVSAHGRVPEVELPAPMEVDFDVDAMQIEAGRGSPISERSSFLGEPLDEPMHDAPRFADRSRFSIESAKRQKRASMAGSSAESHRRISGASGMAFDLGDVDFDVPISQFELPEIEIETERTEPEVKALLSRATQIFRERLDQSSLQRSKAGMVVLSEFLEVNTSGPITKRDAAMSFLQTLVLKTLDVVKVQQSEPYGDIQLRRGPAWSKSLIEEAEENLSPST